VRRRYRECKAVLKSVVLDLGVHKEEQGECVVREEKGAKGEQNQGAMAGKKRSSTERKRWLEAVEMRVRRTGRYNSPNSGPLDGVAEEKEVRGSVPVQRMSGRQAPIEERFAVARHQACEKGTEYAAVAGEKLLHPGINASLGGRVGQLPAQNQGKAQEQPRKTELYGGAPLLRSMQSSNDIPAKQSMNTITTVGTHSIFKSMRYMVFGTRYSKRTTVLRGSRQKSKQKQRSHSTDARLPSRADSVKSRRTTSGLPSEISAGSFGAHPSVNERGEKSKPAPKVQTEIELDRSWPRREHVGCAPGPSTRKPHDDIKRRFCRNCEPARSTAESKGITARRPGSKEPTDKTSAVSLPGPPVPVPKTNPELPPHKYSAFPSRSSTAPRSPLPQTPRYSVSEPLTPQLRKALGVDEKTNAESPPKLNDVLVDKKAIWTRCSERLDHVSAVAATAARARISRERADDAARQTVSVHQKRCKATTQVEKVMALGKGYTTTTADTVRGLQVFATETAERIQIKRVKVGDVDCRSVAGRREVPPRKHSMQATIATSSRRMPPPKQNSPNYEPTAPIQGLNESIRNLSAAATRVAAPSNLATHVASTPVPVHRPLNTPWEAAWHRDLPIRIRSDRPPKPDAYLRAPSVPYSLSDAVSEAEALEAMYRESTDTLARLREGVVAKMGRVVQGADGQRKSLVAVVEEARFDSPMGTDEAATPGGDAAGERCLGWREVFG
jgi:hypothetical protein